MNSMWLDSTSGRISAADFQGGRGQLVSAAHRRHQCFIRPFQHDNAGFARRSAAVEIDLELAALAGVVIDLGLLLEQARHPPSVARLFGLEYSPQYVHVNAPRS